MFLLCLAACGQQRGSDGGDAGADAQTGPGGGASFTDVTAMLGLPTASTTCLIFRDFDRDGRPDLILSVPDNQGIATLEAWANRGSRFVRYPLNRPASDLCAAADFDGDGWVDIAVPGMGPDRANVLLLRNLGTTGFEFEDASARVPNPIRPNFWISAFGDIDGDGWLDLVVGSATLDIEGNIDHCDVSASDFQCYMRPGVQMPDAPVLLHNVSGQHFEQQTLPSAANNWINSFHVIDWDDDGRTDLFLSVDFGRSQLLHNLGGGAFEDLLATLGANPYGHGMGAGIADFDRDGSWDYYHSDIGPAQMWFGTASGMENRARALGIEDSTRTRFSWSPLAVDFDNDGQTDVFVANSATTFDVMGLLTFVSDVGGPNSASVLAPLEDDLFTADGAGFRHATIPHRPTSLMGGTAVAAAGDYDGDGRVDIAEVVAGPAFEFRLLHNENSNANHWLDVRVVGASGNRDAVGATVAVLDGGTISDRRAVGVGGLAGSDAVEHFGLGARASLSGLRVRWPDGSVQFVDGPITADQVFVVQEP